MNEGTMWFVIILISIAIFVVITVLRRLLTKGINAAERAIRPDAAQKADKTLGTAVIFEAEASLKMVRQEIERHVPIVDKIGHKMKVLEDSDECISWAIGLPGVGNGAVVVLQYMENDGLTNAVYFIEKHVTPSTFAISPFVNQLEELLGQVTSAFKAADPSVEIRTDTRAVEHKTSWL